jgi:hypothetical protein
MQPIPRALADHFAAAFAGDKKGFSAREITDFFTNYSRAVKPFDHYGINPTRHDLFIAAVYELLPKQQYYALTDLCQNPPKMKYAVPSSTDRDGLLERLHSFLNANPVGLRLSRLREHTFRQDWYTAYGRLAQNPAATISAARTMLETIFKTIIAERGQTPDNSGELGKLLKQAQYVLKFERAANQEQHRIMQGITNVVHGIAGLSNAAGDRHGLVQGIEIDDPAIAGFALNAAGTLGLIFIEVHLLTPGTISGAVLNP